MKKHLFLFFVGTMLLQLTFAQDSVYVRNTIEHLASKKFKGRGYVAKGDLKAAKYVANEYKKAGLTPVGTNGFFQPYEFSINTFPGKVKARLNNRPLNTGIDYIVYANAPSTKGCYELVYYNDKSLKTDSIKASIGDIDLSNKFLVLSHYDRKFVYENPLQAFGLILATNKEQLIWSASNGQQVSNCTILKIKHQFLVHKPRYITLNIKSKFNEKHTANNIIAKVKGTTVPDSFLVFTAHYDHLGMMGKKTMYPGGNDNASGTAMLLDLANYYAQNPEKYSIVFISVSGEEVGLLGSLYYADHPTIDLSKIKFLINLDMVGSGSDGLGVVNGKMYEEAFARLDSINTKNGYLNQLTKGGESCNSDHCAFHRKGVPSFFIFTKGKECQEYHNPYDVGTNMPLTKYTELFQLLTEFYQTF